MTVVSVDLDPAALTLTIVAEFQAPPAQVWQVWADPRQLERWWGPPTFDATVVDHDLTPGGRVTYFMTGPDGARHHGSWRVVDAEAPHLLRVDDSFDDERGRPRDDLPTTSIDVRITAATDIATTMTVIQRFASIADMEQIIATGTDQGIVLAVGQIDILLSA